MAVLLITYDLHKEPDSEEYTELLETIKSMKPWARLSESSYAVDTSLTPDEVYESIEQYFDEDDNVIVVSLSLPYSGYHSEKLLKWLDKRLMSCE